MRIHREGKVFLILVFLILLVFNSLICVLISNWLLVKIFLASVSTIFFFFFLQFFRNPVRKTLINPKQIIAPADGKVVVIEKTFESEFLKEERIQISIFMSPLNVHVNRNPVSGKILYFKYHPGKYLVAWHPKSSTENERTTVVYETSGKKILMRQIAGAVARRIVWYVKESDEIIQGEDMGFIKFGSRVDLFLPVDAPLKIKIGDRMMGGKTVMAEWS